MEKAVVTDRELLVIGGSAGSLEVVLGLLPGLPQPLRLAIVIVLHRKATSEASIVNLFRYKTTLPVREIEDKDTIDPGTIYIAPVDYHLLIEHQRTFALDVSEKVHFSRPSIDITFESAAEVYHNRLACLLLSGANADGACGLVAARSHGALVAVQDPTTASSSMMPKSAIEKLGNVRLLAPAELVAFVSGL